MPRGRPKKRRIIALIDYDNISSALANHQLKLNFADFMLQMTNIGKIDFAFVIIPYSTYHYLPKINNLGYELVVCQKMDPLGEAEKREDKVDSRTALIGKSFLEYKEITDVILATHDKHSIELASEVIKSGKGLIYFALENEMGEELLDFIKSYDITIYPPPGIEKTSLKLK